MKKEILGEGSVFYAEKLEKWKGKVLWRDVYGEKHTKWFSAKTKKEVQTKITNFKADIENSEEYVENGKTSYTFEDFSEQWFKTFVKPRLKRGSSDRIKTTLEYQVCPYIGHKKMDEITLFDIQNMINTIMIKGLSYSTAKKAYEAVNACYRIYRINFKSSHNPCEGVQLPQNKKKKVSDITFFDEEQCKKICEESVRCHSNGTPVYRLGNAIIVLMYTGLRIGELLALTWDDIDFDNKELTVNKNCVTVKNEESGGKHYILLDQDSTKTDSGERMVPLCNKAIIALKEIQKINGNFKHVMCTKTGNRVSQRNINRLFHSVLTQTGIYETLPPSGRGVHSLRHTFATMLFKKDVAVKIVSVLLGHSDTKITENIYIHVTKQMKKVSIENIDIYFES